MRAKGTGLTLPKCRFFRAVITNDHGDKNMAFDMSTPNKGHTVVTIISVAVMVSGEQLSVHNTQRETTQREHREHRKTLQTSRTRVWIGSCIRIGGYGIEGWPCLLRCGACVSVCEEGSLLRRGSAEETSFSSSCVLITLINPVGWLQPKKETTRQNFGYQVYHIQKRNEASNRKIKQRNCIRIAVVERVLFIH